MHTLFVGSVGHCDAYMWYYIIHDMCTCVCIHTYGTTDIHYIHTCTVHVCVHDIYILYMHIHHYYRRLWMHTIVVEVSPKSVHV